ncbi:MAG TPA: DUF2950 family protein [Bryobacteraceae bacterium]|nr:DUF2950 family protein [Bryobacteraceae bacterium]
MRYRRRGFSLIELLVVVAAIVVVLTVAIPNLLKAKLGAAETMVVREVQTIGQAEMQYASLFGKYAATLAELGPPAAGTAGPQAAELIPGKLASGEKNGYLYTLTLTPLGFAVNANPKEFGNTGRRTFYMDQNGVVHQNWGREAATANSPEL